MLYSQVLAKIYDYIFLLPHGQFMWFQLLSPIYLIDDLVW